MSEFFIIALILLGVGLAFKPLFGMIGGWWNAKKCPQCGKRGHLTVTDKQMAGSWDTTKTVIKTDVSYMTDRYGNRDPNRRIETDREVQVAATATAQRVHYRCEQCGHTFERDVVTIK